MCTLNKFFKFLLFLPSLEQKEANDAGHRCTTNDDNPPHQFSSTSS